MVEIIRDNQYMYITQLTVKDGIIWYQAKMKGLSVTKIGNDLDKLEKEFTEYVKELIGRFNK